MSVGRQQGYASTNWDFYYSFYTETAKYSYFWNATSGTCFVHLLVSTSIKH